MRYPPLLDDISFELRLLLLAKGYAIICATSHRRVAFAHVCAVLIFVYILFYFLFSWNTKISGIMADRGGSGGF